MTWVFVLAVAAHNLEEAIWLPAWSQSVARWHRPVTPREFRLAVAVLTLVAALFAAWADIEGGTGLGVYLVTGYALAMLLNVIFPHLLASLALGRTMPGTVTALLFVLPATSILLWLAFRDGYVEVRRFLVIGPLVTLGVLSSIPALFWLGRHRSRPTRRPS